MNNYFKQTFLRQICCHIQMLLLLKTFPLLRTTVNSFPFHHIFNYILKSLSQLLSFAKPFAMFTTQTSLNRNSSNKFIYNFLQRSALAIKGSEYYHSWNTEEVFTKPSPAFLLKKPFTSDSIHKYMLFSRNRCTVSGTWIVDINRIAESSAGYSGYR